MTREDREPSRTHLTGGQIVMLSHSVGGVHKDLRHGGEVLDGLQPQAQEMAVYGLPVDGLITNTEGTDS